MFSLTWMRHVISFARLMLDQSCKVTFLLSCAEKLNRQRSTFSLLTKMHNPKIINFLLDVMNFCILVELKGFSG